MCKYDCAKVDCTNTTAQNMIVQNMTVQRQKLRVLMFHAVSPRLRVLLTIPKRRDILARVSVEILGRELSVCLRRCRQIWVVEVKHSFVARIKDASADFCICRRRVVLLKE